jgi:hypothetical protein
MEQAQSEIDADDWRAKVDREKEKIRNKKPSLIARFIKAFIKAIKIGW